MKTLLKNGLRGLPVLALTFALLGCASNGGTRLYSGAVHPENQVALILSADASTRVHGIDAREGAQAMRLSTRSSLEVLPGHYPFLISNISSGYNSTTVGKGVGVAADVEADHAYVIYAKIDYKNNKWHPVFVELPTYRQEDCGGGCLDKAQLQALVREHFLGERRSMTLRSWGGWE